MLKSGLGAFALFVMGMALAGTSGSAELEKKRPFDFIAPTIETSSIGFSTIGLIAYDPLEKLFKGRNFNGNWDVLTNPSFVFIKDVKPSGTDGGDFVKDLWNTRDLNTLENIQNNDWVTLSSNQVTLQPGRYEIFARIPAFKVALHQARLRNITDSADTVIGTSERASSGSGNKIVTHSLLSGEFEISNETVFEIQHRSSVTKTDLGLGHAVGFGTDEVYSVVKITRLQ